jgi:glyoxylase-like metal-dependent hydrolase (beta-lactamase superfamily II)
MTSTLIFGEHDAVLVDALTTVAEAEALADGVALHHRNLRIIYITHGHADHFYGLSVLLGRFPNARAIATPVERYRKDVPDAEVHILDAGHFALDTASDEIAELLRGFVRSSDTSREKDAKHQ